MVKNIFTTCEIPFLFINTKVLIFYHIYVSIGNHTVWSSIWNNMHEWVFQKAEIARAASASAISAFWQTHECQLISNLNEKNRMITY